MIDSWRVLDHDDYVKVFVNYKMANNEFMITAKTFDTMAEAKEFLRNNNLKGMRG